MIVQIGAEEVVGLEGSRAGAGAGAGATGPLQIVAQPLKAVSCKKSKHRLEGIKFQESFPLWKENIRIPGSNVKMEILLSWGAPFLTVLIVSLVFVYINFEWWKEASLIFIPREMLSSSNNSLHIHSMCIEETIND